MRTRLFIVFLLLSIFPSFCQEEGKHGSHHGDLIRVFDKVKEFPIEGQIPIDYQEYTFLYASDELGLPDRILLLPDRRLFNLLSSRMEMPANWLEQRDSISVWFSTAPSRPSSVPSRLEKRIPVTFNVKKVDSSAVGGDLHMMLVSDYSSSETDFKQAEVYLIYNLSKAEITNQVPKNVIQTGELAQDPSAIVFVVDGYGWMSPDFTYEKLGTHDVEEILNCFVKAVPFISKDDIDSLTLIKSDEWTHIHYEMPKDFFLITTKKESRIKTFTLNGKPTKRLRGIELGALLDESLLKQRIQKRWRIKSDTIKGLTIEGKDISITTK